MKNGGMIYCCLRRQRSYQRASAFLTVLLRLQQFPLQYYLKSGFVSARQKDRSISTLSESNDGHRLQLQSVEETFGEQELRETGHIATTRIFPSQSVKP